jgi:hypothetical protein
LTYNSRPASPATPLSLDFHFRSKFTSTSNSNSTSGQHLLTSRLQIPVLLHLPLRSAFTSISGPPSHPLQLPIPIPLPVCL